MNRILVLFAGVVALIAALAVPAAATRPPAPGADPAEGHKITICHATRSLSNPYVEVEIDVAAWNDPSDPRHHGDHHTRTKDGITWKDYVLTEGECSLPTTTTSSTTTTTTQPPRGSCAGVEADHVFTFSEFKLYNVTGHVTTTFAVDIDPGTYTVVLGSWDGDHGGPTGDQYNQLNERWRANFGSGVITGFTDDLGDTEGALPGDAVATDVGNVTIGSPVTILTAEHWSIANPTPLGLENDLSWRNSVIPSCVGLTLSD
jgi:hypothetical protein